MVRAVSAMLVGTLLCGCLVALGQTVPEGRRIFANDGDTIYEIAVDSLTGLTTACSIFHLDYDWVILDLKAGPDGLLYFSDTFHHRIIRCDPDGAFWEIVAQDERIYPAETTFDDRGNLYFSNTVCRFALTRVDCPDEFAGIWIVENATDAEPGPLRRLISPDAYGPYPIERGWCRSPELRYVPSGPFSGGLLTDAVGGFPSLCVVTDPDRFRCAPFVREEDCSKFSRRLSEDGCPTDVTAFDEAFTPSGDLLATDPFGNQILRFGPDGTYLGRFAAFPRPSKLAVDSEGHVYATSDDDVLRIFDSVGTLLSLIFVGRPVDGIAVLE